MSGFTPDRIRDRAGRAMGVLAVTFLLLVAAFFRAQVIGYKDYRLQSEKNRLRQVPLLAPRGAIIDRNGLTIVENEPGYTVKLFAPSLDSMRAVLNRLATLVPLDSAAIRVILGRFRSAQYQPALVFTGADFGSVSRLEEHRYLLPGLVVQTEPRRVYKSGAAIAHLVGYVSEVSEADLERNRFPGARMGSIVGRDGLEQEYDSLLRGIDGVRYTEVDARGRMVREEVSSPSLAPVAGGSITTTIDLQLQLFIDSLWNAEKQGTRGAMVAMTPDGGVLALYSHPAYDPNRFVGGIDPGLWAAYNSDKSVPLYNRALQATYPPASPFKLATAVMALRRGIVKFDTHMPIACRGALQYGSRAFRCWRREGHGSLDLTGAIAASCDVYFYQLGLRIGLPNFLEQGTELGFGERSGIDLGKESRPIFPENTEYYNRRYGPRGWTPAVTLNVAIGQGENSQTLMNMMRFYAALAGDGTAEPPFIVQRRSGSTPRTLGLSPENLAGLRTALCAVVARGTASGSGGRELNVCGKTGTAQNPHGSDHGWFIGYAPADKPQIVVGAIMEDLGGHGGASVAPYVVRAMRNYLIRKDSTLSKARIKVPVVDDSVTNADTVARPDTIRP